MSLPENIASPTPLIHAPFFHYVEFESSHARLLTSTLSHALGMPIVGTLNTEHGVSYCLQSQQAMIICSSPKTHKNADAPFNTSNDFHAGLKNTQHIRVSAIGIQVADPEYAHAHLSSTVQADQGESLQVYPSGLMDLKLPNLLGHLRLRFLHSKLHAAPHCTSGIPYGIQGFTPCTSEDGTAQAPAFLPGGISSIDHVAINVRNVNAVCERLQALTTWTPFRVFDEAILHRPLGALTLSSQTQEGLLTIVQATKRSSIFEHALQDNGGPYVHHIALRCDDIFQLADALSAHGAWKSMPPPAANYYNDIRSTALQFLPPAKFDKLQHYGMLLDFEDNCALVQVFLPYLDDVPGVFFELISRVPRLDQPVQQIPAAGCGGFGDRNVAQLYDCLIRGVGQLPSVMDVATSTPTDRPLHKPTTASESTPQALPEPVAAL